MGRSGYGFAPGQAPPFGRRKRAFAGTGSERSTPTTDWGSLLRTGHYTVRAYLIFGIPYVFAERELKTITGATAAAPSDDYTVSHSLHVGEGQGKSCEIDREKGLASGRARDIVLRRQSLEDESILTALFKRPSLRAVLSEDVDDPDATVFPVTATLASWPESGGFYAGHEYVQYTSTGAGESGTAGSFEGCRRGVAGLVHYHTASSRSGYRECTDVPVYWRGRYVVEYEHLVTPEGRFLGDTWCVVDTYCRERWKGYVEDVPQENAIGKVLRCLPIERKLSEEVGAKFVGKPVFTNNSVPPTPMIYVEPNDIIRIRDDSAAVTGEGPHDAITHFLNINAWCSIAERDIKADLSLAYVEVDPVIFGDGAGHIRIRVIDAVTTIACLGLAWFLSHDPVSGDGGEFHNLGLDWNAGQHGWLVVALDEGDDFVSADVPAYGYARLDGPTGHEIVYYSRTVTSSSAGDPGYVGLCITQRAMFGTTKQNPWNPNWACKVTLITGAEGSWAEVFRRLVTSSGTGARGDFDTLAFGFGLGLPDEWIDTEAMTGTPMGTTYVAGVPSGRAAVDETLCGWLALWGRCMVQRRNSAGHIVLAPVQTGIVDDTTATTVGADDVLLGGHGTPSVLAAPNQIQIDATPEGGDTQKTIVRDVARVQAEGARTWEINAPGAADSDALAYALAILTNGDGQATIELELEPGTEVQPGDMIDLTTAHPIVYDWSAGSYAPSSVLARVLGVEESDWTGIIRATCLLAGQARPGVHLCPSAEVTQQLSGTTMAVVTGHEAFFAAGDAVYIYEPGNEATRRLSDTVDAVTAATAYEPAKITINNALDTWVGPGCIVTFDVYTADTATQQRKMFVRSDKAWI